MLIWMSRPDVQAIKMAGGVSIQGEMREVKLERSSSGRWRVACAEGDFFGIAKDFELALEVAELIAGRNREYILKEGL